MGIFSDFLGLGSRKDARNAAGNAALGNFSLTGPGGMSVGFTPTSGNVALGSLDPIRAALLQAAGGSLLGGTGTGGLNAAGAEARASLGSGGIDPAFVNVLMGLTGKQIGSGAAPGFGASGINPALLSLLTGSTLGQAGSGVVPTALRAAVSNVQGMTDIDPALAAKLATVASSKLGTAGASADAVAADRLAMLREQAQPYEQDFIRKSIGDLFAKGRFGSNDSLSGKVSEGVARALSGADIERQMDAQELGRLTQNDAVSQALGLSAESSSLIGERLSRALQQLGAGFDLFGAEQTGMNAETSRLGNLSALIENAVGNQYSRNVAGYQAGQSGADSEIGRILSLLSGAQGVTSATDNRAVQRFGIAQELFNAQDASKNSALTRSLGALQGVQGIDSAGMQAFMAALQGAVAKSNAAAGQAQIFNTISQNRPINDAFTGLLGAFMPG